MAAARLASFGETYYKVPFIARYEIMKDSPREMASAVVSTMIGALQSRIARCNAGRLYRVIPQLEMSLLRIPPLARLSWRCGHAVHQPKSACSFNVEIRPFKETQ
jgi:hypothetical protein